MSRIPNLLSILFWSTDNNNIDGDRFATKLRKSYFDAINYFWWANHIPKKMETVKKKLSRGGLISIVINLAKSTGGLTGNH